MEASAGAGMESCSDMRDAIEVDAHQGVEVQFAARLGTLAKSDGAAAERWTSVGVAKLRRER